MIYDYSPFSLVDYPGLVASVVYFNKCNYACPTCHNKKLVYGKEPKVLPVDVKNYLYRNPFIQGVCITGGEPFESWEELLILINYIKINTDLKIKVDTNGTSLDKIKHLITTIDLFAVDVKGPLSMYQTLTKYRDTEVDKILEFAKDYKEKFIFRCTLVPALTQKDIDTTVNLVESFGFNLILQPYKEPRCY